MKITIKDVAKKANVSVSTVSRVFTGAANVSAQKKEAVLEAARALAFKPNHVARSLKLSHSYTLGLLMPDIGNPYYSLLARSAEMTARKHGYSLLLADSNNDLQRECSYLNWLAERRVDGIILATVGDDPTHVEKLKALVPVVMVGRRLPIDGVDFVFADNYQVGFLAAEHLMHLGHRSLGIIAGSKHISSTKMRVQGFCDCLQDWGLTLPADKILYGDFSLESGGRLVRQMYLGSGVKPTALFCLNDQIAVGAIKVLVNLGYDIPRDVSVIGCDNTYVAEICQPELTTINRPINEMGIKAIELLIERIEKGRKRTKHISIPLTLITRSSTTKPSGVW